MKRFGNAQAALFFFAAPFTQLLLPKFAAAHLVTTGMGPVYDGIGHLLLTPEDLIPAIAIALYAGLRGKDQGRKVLLFLPLAWLAGGLAGMILPVSQNLQLPFISFLLLGALIAADLRLPDSLITILVITVGMIHGWYNGMAMADGPGVSGLLGIMAALFVLVSLASAVVVSLRAGWARVAVRVTGSWITAIGLLMLGWTVKGGG